MSKGPDAFRTISEVAEELDLPQHVLRFWETRFTQIKPMKRGGGRRYYRPDDIELLRGIRRLLYGEGYTIKGVQRILKEQGPRHLIAAGQGISLDASPDGDEPDDYGDDTAEAMDYSPGSGLDDFDDAPDPVDHGRREPMFGTHAESAPERHHAAPSVRMSGERPLPQETSFHGRSHAPEPAQPVHSRIPAAPPDLPSSADDYLPPLVADLPMPPERGTAHARPESPYAPPQASSRREPHLSQNLPHGDRDDHPGPEPMTNAAPAPSAGRGAERHATSQQASEGLGHGDRERLQATLMELLECKRILDNVR